MSKKRCANFTDHVISASLSNDLCYLNEGYELEPDYQSGLTLLNLEGTPGNFKLFGKKTWHFTNKTTYIPRKIVECELAETPTIQERNIIPLFYWCWDSAHNELQQVNSIQRIMLDNMNDQGRDFHFNLTINSDTFNSNSYRIVWGYRQYLKSNDGQSDMDYHEYARSGEPSISSQLFLSKQYADTWWAEVNKLIERGDGYKHAFCYAYIGITKYENPDKYEDLVGDITLEFDAVSQYHIHTMTDGKYQYSHYMYPLKNSLIGRNDHIDECYVSSRPTEDNKNLTLPNYVGLDQVVDSSMKCTSADNLINNTWYYRLDVLGDLNIIDFYDVKDNDTLYYLNDESDLKGFPYFKISLDTRTFNNDFKDCFKNGNIFKAIESNRGSTQKINTVDFHQYRDLFGNTNNLNKNIDLYGAIYIRIQPTGSSKIRSANWLSLFRGKIGTYYLNYKSTIGNFNLLDDSQNYYNKFTTHKIPNPDGNLYNEFIIVCKNPSNSQKLKTPLYELIYKKNTIGSQYKYTFLSYNQRYSENYDYFYLQNILTTTVEIWLKQTRNPYEIDLWYSFNKKNWEAYRPGDRISLSPSTKVYFKNMKQGFSKDYNNHYTFVANTTASLKAGGHLDTLFYDYLYTKDSDRNLNNYSFCYLFSGSYVKDIKDLYFPKVHRKGLYYYMFTNNTALSNIPLANNFSIIGSYIGVTYEDYEFYGMFNNCSNLPITVYFEATSGACLIIGKTYTFRKMFYGCSKLQQFIRRDSNDIYFQNAGSYTFAEMFENTELSDVRHIIIMSNKNCSNGFRRMFANIDGGVLPPQFSNQTDISGAGPYAFYEFFYNTIIKSINGEAIIGSQSHPLPKATGASAYYQAFYNVNQLFYSQTKFYLESDTETFNDNNKNRYEKLFNGTPYLSKSAPYLNVYTTVVPDAYIENIRNLCVPAKNNDGNYILNVEPFKLS